MLKDITLGQYFPGNSVIHRMDSRFKIVLDILYVVILFVADNYVSLAIAGIFILMAYAVSEIKPVMMLKSLKPLMPLILFTAILNLFFVKGEGEPLVDWWIFHIYMEGISTAVFMIVRIVCLIIGMSLLTYTTSPIVLTDAIERLLSPLKKIKLPVHELAMMMTIALRFIPTLIEETQRIMKAQASRGVDLEEGSFKEKVMAILSLIVPLFVSAFQHADDLANAMEARGYVPDQLRTRYKQLVMRGVDFLTLAVAVVLMVALIMMAWVL